MHQKCEKLKILSVKTRMLKNLAKLSNILGDNVLGYNVLGYNVLGYNVLEHSQVKRSVNFYHLLVKYIIKFHPVLFSLSTACF